MDPGGARGTRHVVCFKSEIPEIFVRPLLAPRSSPFPANRVCNCVARFLSSLCTSPQRCPDFKHLNRCARHRNWNLFLKHFDFALSEVLPRLASLPPSLCSLPLWSFIFSSSALLACCPSLCLVRENLSCLLRSLRPNLCRLLNCPSVSVRPPSPARSLHTSCEPLMWL